MGDQVDTPSPSSSSGLTPRRVTYLSVVVNLLLAAVKIVAGVFFRSQAIFADGLHSGSDLVTDAAVLAGLRVSDKPADGCHPYGHRRISTLVALFVGAMLIAAAAWIAYEAAVRLHDFIDGRGGPDVHPAIPFLVAVLSVPVKEIMFRLTRYVGRVSGDVSLTANAWHHRSDAFSSIAAAVGLGGAWIGGRQWLFLDPVFAIVLSFFLAGAAVKIMYDAAAELVDSAPDPKTLESIRQAVADTKGVRGYHAFRARRIGGRVEMDIHVQVDPTLTVFQGHEIASAVKRHVMNADPAVTEAIVHIEPAQNTEKVMPA